MAVCRRSKPLDACRLICSAHLERSDEAKARLLARTRSHVGRAQTYKNGELPPISLFVLASYIPLIASYRPAFSLLLYLYIYEGNTLSFFLFLSAHIIRVFHFIELDRLYIF